MTENKGNKDKIQPGYEMPIEKSPIPKMENDFIQ